MENQQTTPVEEQKASSFTERLTNVFASPGELFGEVARLPVQTSSWTIPFILMLLLALLSTIVVLSNQTLRDQALEPQRQALQERVNQGEMTQDQVDQATEMMESSSMTLIFGSVSALVMAAVGMFGIPLAIWLAVKIFFKSQAGYKKFLEVYGLSLIIGLLGSVITLLMIFLFDSIYASLGGGLLVMNDFDRHNLAHVVLSSFNLITIWQMIVMGIGIAKVSNKSNGAGISLALGLWLLWVIVISFISGLG